MQNREKDFYEAAGSRYDAVMAGNSFAYFIERRKELLRSLRLNDRSTHILDLGCGTGIYKEAISDCHYLVGADYSFSSLKAYSGKYPGSLLINSDACSIPIKSSSMDAVIAFGLVHHLYRKADDLLSEISRVVKKGGALIIDEPNGYNLFWHLILNLNIGKEVDGGYSKPVTPGFLKRKLAMHGFTISEQAYWGFFPPSLLKLRSISNMNKIIENSFLGRFSMRYTIIGIRS